MTSGIKKTGTVIDSGIIRPSSVTKRSTLRGALSGSPSSLVSPLNPAIGRKVSSASLARILFRQDAPEDVETPRSVIDRDHRRPLGLNLK
jgi:hypothetical protein